MNSEQKERERLKRLREQQIASRDPGPSKIRHFDWSTTGKKPITRPPKPFLVELWEILPNRWKGALYGFLFGAVIAAFLLFLLPDEWDILAVVPLLIASVVGMVIGKLFQEEIPR